MERRAGEGEEEEEKRQAGDQRNDCYITITTKPMVL